MRHRVAKLQLGRNTKQRSALLRELVVSLFKYGSITTTLTKAKEVRRIADKLISRAQADSAANRRLIHRFFGKRDVVNTLFERIAPALSDRKSGFSQLKIVGNRRGDNTQLAVLSFVKSIERAGTLKSTKKNIDQKITKKTKVTKKTTK